MSYVTRADIEAEIEPVRLAQMLDDDRDGSEDTGLFAALADAVDSEIDGVISLAVSVPVSPVPAYLRHAARVLFCDLLYRRAGSGSDLNPYKDRAQDVRDRLDRIADGSASLDATGGSAFGISEIADKVFLRTEEEQEALT